MGPLDVAVTMTSQRQPAATRPEPAGLTPFCFLWAVTQFLDLLCFPEWVFQPTGIALFVASVAVLAKPSSSRRFLAMCGLNLAYLWARSPITPNHVLFEGFVNIVILGVALRHWRARPETSARTAVFSEAAPVLRVLLLSLYFFAFLHKLNWDFLTPATGCAGFMLQGLAEQIPVVPVGPFMKSASIWATLLVEGGIPILLLFPRTRMAALLIAWPFHFMLSFHTRPGIYAFSSMLFTQLTLFLPPSFFAKLERLPLVQQAQNGLKYSRQHIARLLLFGALAAALGALALLLSGFNIRGTGLTKLPRFIGLMLWIPYAFGLLAMLIFGWPKAVSGPAVPLIKPAWRSPAILVAGLFVLNCFAPYLGFQTLRTMSMFSSIRTEGGRNNHLFIPAGLQITNLQDDLVRIISSSDIWLNYYADGRSLITYTELRRRAWEDLNRPVQVTFERNGRIQTVDTSDAHADSQLPPLAFPLHKILAFRVIDSEGPVNCRW